jgi:DNA-3-methyladenine glycosylase II
VTFTGFHGAVAACTPGASSASAASVADVDTVSLRPGVAALVAADPALARVVAEHGEPPRWQRPAGLPTVVLLVLEQQISLDAARAHFDRLVAACGGALAPDRLLDLDDDTLLAAGVSRQKRRYLRDLATRVVDGRLDLDGLADRDDDGVRRSLTAVLGIGAWTADCYLLAALGRPDVWPVGDVALQQGAAEVLDLPDRPDAAALSALGERWRPHRSEAARLLWHAYLRRRGRAVSPL